MTVDLAKIEQLVDLVSRSRIAELELTQDGTRVRIVKDGGRAQAPAPSVAPQASNGASDSAHEAPPPPAASSPEEIVIPAPMHGVFYRAASPDDPPLVEVGAAIAAGQKICIIEAMKTFIDVVAEAPGVVLAILAENGAEIEAGQALFRIRPTGPA